MRWLIPAVLCLAAAAPAPRAADAPGGSIVYSRSDGGRFLLHVMNADGSGDRLLPGQTAQVNLFPSWSPDGKRIAFTTAPAVNAPTHGVALINADGTGLVDLPVPSMRAGLAAWSPDGKQLAFISGEEIPAVYVCGADGNGQR